MADHAPLADVLARLHSCEWIDLTPARASWRIATPTSGSEAPTWIRPPTSRAAAVSSMSCRSERWPDGEAMANRDAEGAAHYPGWGVEALTFLVEDRGVTAIGHDTTDTDPGAVVSAGTAPAETYILSADKWQIEMLAGLDQVPPTGALVVATWPKPHEGSGFSARVFAIVDRG